MAIPTQLSNFIFRARYSLHVAIFVLGWLTPWNWVYRLDPPGPNAHVWGLLAVRLGLTGSLTISQAFNLLLVLGIVCATLGAYLRVWGSAYLGIGLVYANDMQMTEGSPVPHTPPLPEDTPGLLTDGPYRHMRNPLYLGTFFVTLSFALLMTTSGAIFTVLAIGILQILLILGEEQFLSRRLGDAYSAYCALVPRLMPRLRARVQGTGRTASWPQALLGELFFVGVAACYASVGWLYNAHVLQQSIVVSFGISLVAQAVFPARAASIKEPSASKG